VHLNNKKQTNNLTTIQPFQILKAVLSLLTFLSIIIQLQLDHGSIHGSNSDDPSFFANFFSSLLNFSNGPIIIGGDYNTVINPSLDRSKHTGKSWKSSKTIKQLIMSDFGLGDGWRLKTLFILMSTKPTRGTN